MILEACISNLESLETSLSCGIQRVELCSALSLGGLSPSPSLVDEACQFPNLTVMCLIRPREGSFVYSGKERRQIFSEIEFYLERGAHGIVFGCLDNHGYIDIPLLREIRLRFPKPDFTFHRAFDSSIGDAVESAQILVDEGIPRLLSSGKSAQAIQGIDLLSQLNHRFSHQLSIMPGGGIRSATLPRFIEAGFYEFHSSGSPGTKETQPETALFPQEYLRADQHELLACLRLLKQAKKMDS